MVERNPRWGQWGQRGATNLSASESERRQWCLGLGGAEARRLAVSKGCRLSAGGGQRVADVTETKKGGRYAEPWVPVQEGRERPLAWLDRGNSAGPEVTGLGVSISEI